VKKLNGKLEWGVPFHPTKNRGEKSKTENQIEKRGDSYFPFENLTKNQLN
jgi:hypothetical protein